METVQIETIQRKRAGRKKNGKGFWRKGLIAWLAVMMIFTVTSRIADSFTVARVNVANISRHRIRHTATAAGRVEADGERAVVTEPGILVESVAVREGESVKKGKLLMALSMESISGQIASVDKEIQTIELQNKALEENREREAAKQSREIRRAKKDQADTAKKNAEIVKEARQDYEKAKQDLEKAKKGLQRAKEKLNAYDPKEAGEDMDKETVKELEDKAEAKREARDACKEVLSEKKEALEAAKRMEQEENKMSARALEDAREPQASDNSVKINELSMEELKSKRNKLQSLKKQRGKIQASRNGYITKVNVSVGEKTADTAAMIMSDENTGLRFTAQIEKDEIPFLSVGDKVTLEGNGKKEENCRIISMEMDEGGELCNVTAELKAGSFAIGEGAVMNAVQDSEEYPYTVESTALLQENNKAFLLVLDEEDTVLGQQYVARKVEVDIIEQNNNYAALEGSGLSEDTRVIIDSDRYVEAGERVRLAEQ